jgi:hypothetical protein
MPCSGDAIKLHADRVLLVTVPGIPRSTLGPVCLFPRAWPGQAIAGKIGHSNSDAKVSAA